MILFPLNIVDSQVDVAAFLSQWCSNRGAHRILGPHPRGLWGSEGQGHRDSDAGRQTVIFTQSPCFSSTLTTSSEVGPRGFRWRGGEGGRASVQPGTTLSYLFTPRISLP